MDAHKIQEKAMEKMEVAKEVIVEKAEELASDVRVRSHKVGHTLHEKVTHPYDTIDQTRAGLDSMFSAQRMDRAKDKIETEASIMVGYKDQFLGAIKEAFGHMLKDEKLKAHGHQQRIKGQTEVKLQKALEEERKFQRVRAQIVEVLMRREALLSELVRSGGFEVYGREHMRHVELKEEPSVGLLFAAPGVGRTSFSLKHYNVQPLLNEIRERRTMKPMVFVQVREKGLLRSIPLTRKDIKGFKGRSDRYLDLFAAIRRSGTWKLHPVPSAKIHDRSAPRLDLFRTIAAADEHRSELMRDIVSQTGRSHLIHVAGAETFKGAAAADNGAGVAPKRGNQVKAQLLDELRQADVDLKHVETVDKSQPTIGKDVQLKTWDKKGFLDEVRQGTELKHI